MLNIYYKGCWNRGKIEWKGAQIVNNNADGDDPIVGICWASVLIWDDGQWIIHMIISN